MPRQALLVSEVLVGFTECASVDARGSKDGGSDLKIC